MKRLTLILVLAIVGCADEKPQPAAKNGTPVTEQRKIDPEVQKEAKPVYSGDWHNRDKAPRKAR